MNLFCIDTSSIIEAWERRYPNSVFPSIYKKLEELVVRSVLISPNEVKRELEKKADGAFEWAKRQNGLFVPEDEGQLEAVSQIMSSHQPLIANKKGRNVADPFVVALAISRNAIVITEEDLGTDSRPKIPNVCRDYNVKCMKLVEFMAHQKWSF